MATIGFRSALILVWFATQAGGRRAEGALKSLTTLDDEKATAAAKAPAEGEATDVTGIERECLLRSSRESNDCVAYCGRYSKSKGRGEKCKLEGKDGCALKKKDAKAACNDKALVLPGSKVTKCHWENRANACVMSGAATTYEEAETAKADKFKADEDAKKAAEEKAAAEAKQAAAQAAAEAEVEEEAKAAKAAIAAKAAEEAAMAAKAAEEAAMAARAAEEAAKAAEKTAEASAKRPSASGSNVVKKIAYYNCLTKGDTNCEDPSAVRRSTLNANAAAFVPAAAAAAAVAEIEAVPAYDAWARDDARRWLYVPNDSDACSQSGADTAYCMGMLAAKLSHMTHGDPNYLTAFKEAYNAIAPETGKDLFDVAIAKLTAA